MPASDRVTVDAHSDPVACSVRVTRSHDARSSIRNSQRETTMRETICLWAFVPAALEAKLPAIRAEFRWARPIVVPKSDRPWWARAMPPLALVICESYGEYNGFLGDPVEADDRDAARNGERAASRTRDHRGARLDEHVIRRFLVATTSEGSITLVFDDGGLVWKSEQEAHAMQQRVIHPKEPVSFNLSDQRASVLSIFPMPYWTPVILY